MKTVVAKIKSNEFLAVMLLLHSALYLTIFLNIEIVRQVVAFFYLTFIPGFIALKLFKPDSLDRLDIILFSIGLSIAFTFAVGLAISQFGKILGFYRPLSLIPLLITMSGITLIGSVLVHARNGHLQPGSISPPRSYSLSLIFICLPIIGILGAVWVNIYQNNLILLFLIVLICALLTLGLFFKKFLPEKLYPFALLMASSALLLAFSLFSNYLVTFGSDIAGESYLFKTTLNSGLWNASPLYSGELLGRLSSMLSVTIFPTVYSVILNMEPFSVLKIVYPLIFSITPIAFYQLWRKSLGYKGAFLAAFLLMAQSTFYTEMLGLTRQMIAELFFILLWVVILRKMKPSNKMLYFFVFSFGLITSHYALAEIFFFFMISIFLVSTFVLKRASKNVSLSMVVLFFVMMFAWYIFTSGAAVFDSFLTFGASIYWQLGDFFTPASRGATVLRGLGLESAPSIWNTLSRTFAYVTEGLIIIGFASLILNRAKIRLEKDHFILCASGVVILGGLVVVPGLAGSLNITRFYHILLFFLAPLCVIASGVIAKFLFKKDKQLLSSFLLLVIIIPYFLFQTGFVYEVTKTESWSLPLSSYRMDSYKLYYGLGDIDGKSVYAAEWLAKYFDIRKAPLYADWASIDNLLPSYGNVYGGDLSVLSGSTIVMPNGVVYLNSLNTIYGIIANESRLPETGRLTFLEDTNMIYSNGGGEIYKDPR